MHDHVCDGNANFKGLKQDSIVKVPELDGAVQGSRVELERVLGVEHHRGHRVRVTALLDRAGQDADDLAGLDTENADALRVA